MDEGVPLKGRILHRPRSSVRVEAIELKRKSRLTLRREESFELWPYGDYGLTNNEYDL
jgi:hypothetical protein